ncbi:MAG: hypothetical protein JO308_09655, partial [Verrucomicrobia bacterium]|nr:hypothetical protein [Verrucomicrobiota bacterium]
MKLIGVAIRRPHTLRSRPALAGCLAIALLSTLGLSAVALGADASVPANLDSHLQRWVEQSMLNGTANTPRAFSIPLRTPQMMGIPGRFDAQGRALVQIHLDGTQSMQAVENALRSQQIQILAKNNLYRHGVFAGYLTAAQVEAAAKTAGVRSVRLEGVPHANVGAVTSEGTVVLKTDLVNKEGFKGDGITVGVLSDSFNTALLNVQNPPFTTAADDVASGDLPVVNV